MTTFEAQNTQSAPEKVRYPHRLRKFLLGAGVLVGGLVLLDAHEVKDPRAGITIADDIVSDAVKDITGKDNIYLDWVDVGAMAMSGAGLAIMVNAASRRPGEA